MSDIKQRSSDCIIARALATRCRYHSRVLEDLKELIRAEPFCPFRIILASGSHYDVTSPYQIAIGNTQLDYYFPKSDRKAVLRQNQLASLETLDRPVA